MYETSYTELFSASVGSYEPSLEKKTSLTSSNAHFAHFPFSLPKSYFLGKTYREQSCIYSLRRERGFIKKMVIFCAYFMRDGSILENFVELAVGGD